MEVDQLGCVSACQSHQWSVCQHTVVSKKQWTCPELSLSFSVQV